MNFFVYFIFVIFSIVKASNNSDNKLITNHPFNKEVEKTTPEDFDKNNNNTTNNIDVVIYSFTKKQQVFWFLAMCSIALLIIVGVYGYMTFMS